MITACKRVQLPPLAQKVFYLVAGSDYKYCFALQLESYRLSLVLFVKVYGMFTRSQLSNEGGTTRAASIFWS